MVEPGPCFPVRLPILQLSLNTGRTGTSPASSIERFQASRPDDSPNAHLEILTDLRDPTRPHAAPTPPTLLDRSRAAGRP